MCSACIKAKKEREEQLDPTLTMRRWYQLQEETRYAENLPFQQIKPKESKTTKESNKPMNVNVEYAVQSAVEQKLVERETKKRLEAIDSYDPFENAEDGTVLQFKKASTAKKDSKVVTYTVVKNGETWNVSGGDYTGSTFTWGELVTWMSKPVPVVATDIKKATFA